MVFQEGQRGVDGAAAQSQSSLGERVLEQFVRLFPDDKIKQVVDLYRRVQLIDLKNQATEMFEKASLVKNHVE